MEKKSRLNKNETRGIENDWATEYLFLLQEAKKDFQESIRIDPNFLKGHINLACVYDLLGNSPRAIGEILELQNQYRDNIQVKKILAIAYYHNGEIAKSENIWNTIKQ